MPLRRSTRESTLSPPTGFSETGPLGRCSPHARSARRSATGPPPEASPEAIPGRLPRARKACGPPVRIRSSCLRPVRANGFLLVKPSVDFSQERLAARLLFLAGTARTRAAPFPQHERKRQTQNESQNGRPDERPPGLPRAGEVERTGSGRRGCPFRNDIRARRSFGRRSRRTRLARQDLIEGLHDDGVASSFVEPRRHGDEALDSRGEILADSAREDNADAHALDAARGSDDLLDAPAHLVVGLQRRVELPVFPPPVARFAVHGAQRRRPGLPLHDLALMHHDPSGVPARRPRRDHVLSRAPNLVEIEGDIDAHDRLPWTEGTIEHLCDLAGQVVLDLLLHPQVSTGHRVRHAVRLVFKGPATIVIYTLSLRFEIPS